jgi:P27 family predicted phage terminase small subunit
MLPEPPDFLTPGAAERFAEVVAMLGRAGTLAETDVALVARYAAVFDRWRAAERELAESGSAIHFARLTDRNGNPASSVPTAPMAQAAKCSAELSKLESELGLTPRSRTTVASTVPAERDEFDELFDRD